MDFPHLADSTAFPGTQNVNPYRFKNTFDYHRWDAGTVLKLCNVNWSEDDDNVVKFEDDAARDKYFDEISGESQTLQSQARIMSDSSVKVPLPFDECSKYNYLMVDIKTATSDTNPIDYETLKHMSRFYFFVLDYEEIAPNTTKLYLLIDYWTTYINRIEIGNMLLERGHAPMAAAADVETYLSNPIANTDNLLVEDFDYGQNHLIKNGNFVPFGNGAKYVLMASTINAQMAGTLPAATYSFDGEISFSDDEGSETIVAGSGKDAALSTVYGATGLVTTPSMNAATSITAHDDYIYNGYTIYAIQASTLGSLVPSEDFPAELYPANATLADYLTWKFPQFIESVAAMYVVTEDMFTKGATVTIGGDDKLTFAVATSAQNTLFNLNLTKEMFGYEEPYSELTKLYTSPYAIIELTDAYGNKKTIGTERISNMAVRNKVSIAYPVLKFEAFITGIDSDQPDLEYQWMNLNDVETQRVISNDAFRDFSYWHDIPTFELFMSGYVHHALHNYNAENTIPQLEDQTSYGNAVRSANVSQINAQRSAAASLNNANDSADTAYDNTDAAALAAYLNAQASAATALSNANSNADTALTNTEASADTSLQNETASATTGQANANASAATALGNANRSATAAQESANASAATALGNANRSATAAQESANASAATALGNANRAAEYEKTIADDTANNTKRNAIQFVNPNTQAIATNNATTKRTNASRLATTTYNNANASADATKLNSDASASNAQTNTYASATTGYNNSVRSANNSQTNANASATTAQTNTANIGTSQTTNTATMVAQSLANTNENNTNVTETTKAANDLLQAQQAWDAGYSRDMTALLENSAAVTNVSNGIGGMLMGFASGGAMGAGAAAANFLGSVVNSAIAFGFQSNETELTVNYTQNKLNEVRTNSTDNTTRNVNTATNINATNSNAMTAITANSVATANTNAANNTETTAANATRDHDTAVSNADETQTTTKANADRTLSTSQANNERTQTTTKANASRTYNAYMGPNSGGIPGSGGNIQADYDAAIYAANANKTTSDNVANANNTLALSNNEKTNYIKVNNAADTNTTALANATRAYNATTGNAADTNTTTLANATRAYNATTGNAADTNTTALENAQRSTATSISNATNSNTTTKANAERSNTNAKAVAAATNATTLANAKRTYDAATGNADNTRETTKGNAQRTNDTNLKNAEDSRDIAIYNEQQTMAKNQQVKRLLNYDKRLDEPYKISHVSGQADSDEFAWRGLLIQIKTERPVEYKRAGDMFLRYGYAIHRNWTVTDLNIMPHFTYWKAEDLWLIGGVGVMEAAQRAIRDKILNGVTVWRDPNEVGGISIYENN